MHSFDEHEFKHVRSSFNVDASDLPGAFPIDESDIRVIGLEDIMDRDERADLVAVQVHGLQASVPGTSSAESALLVRWELRAGPGDELIATNDSDFTDNSGESGVVDTNFWTSDSPDALFFASWVAEGGFADTSSGLGGGPDQPVIESERNFPRELGSCPEFDDRDEITESLYLNDLGGADISDSSIFLEASYSLVFAVRDRDD
jgi:hypothetical protein